MSNYKVRYHGDGLITEGHYDVFSLSLSIFLRVSYFLARARSRDWKCASSWHAINPDPLQILILLFLYTLRNFIDVPRAHYFTCETANKTL